MTSFTPRTLLRSLRADRRGVSSLAFAAAAVGFFGAVAIAADAGVWYSARRGAQNAADAGSAIAAVALSMSGATQARTAALDVASRNGFPNVAPTTVAVNIPPSSGPNVGNATAVEVVIRQQQGLGAAGFFLSTPPIVQGRSVASLREASNVCILALNGQLWAGGNTAVNTPNCVLASNRRSIPSAEIVGNSLSINAFSISTVTTCLNCENGNVVLAQRFREYQPPTLDPYTALNTKVMPRASNGCTNRGGGNNRNLTPFEKNNREVYCGDIRINGGEVVTVEPGTYYLFNGSLFVMGGGSLTCPTCTNGEGVVFVFTGDPASIGGVQIAGNSTVNIRAARLPKDPDYAGILFYRDIRATTNNINNPAVDIAGTAGINLAGGMYFPSSHVRFIGTSGTVACSVLVANSIDFQGTSDVTGCAETGTRVPQTRMVVVSE
ncbi:hypothetical protein DFH01_26560 [Falsiroseomonas bella]|uniref:Uncharacterized protein n=1 Tax=Falsiroseomonas bella TaxID=2184016 RepID=A0A317F6N1_9PROT|nr:hypothetical protein [Falsiroseomonas bella]PWS34192.1 hypothetical protein DFH01_26560 [Falsiroseomonas bella]